MKLNLRELGLWRVLGVANLVQLAGLLVLSVSAALAGVGVSWDTSTPPDPSPWPYGDTNDFSDIPTPQTQPAFCYVYRPSAVQANERVYIVGGRMSSAPSGYVNAHSHLSIFNPFESNPSNMWSAAKWDGSGPCGINMGGGTTRPTRPNGVAPAGVALGTYDVDFDGTEELFLFSGENHPGNTVMMYDPDSDSWTNRTGTSGIVNVMTCAGGQVGGKYYLHGAPDSMFVYDFLAESWQTVPIANFPQKTVQCGSASDGQKIYMPWGAYDNIARTSSNSFGLAMYIYDTGNPSNVVAGVPPPFGCNQAAVVGYRDRVYLFGGRITGGADSSTNLIQVYFIGSNSWYISKDCMPANINAPAAWFANRRVVIANGYLFNNGAQPNQTTNVLWSADIRQLDPPFPTALDVFPSTLDFGMTDSTGIYYVGDAGGIGLDYTNIVTAPWLAVTPAAGATAGLAYRTNTVVINRTLITTPVTGAVQVVSGGETSEVKVIVTLTSGALWTEKAQNPAWFPYQEGSGSSQLMDLPIPTATPGFMVSPGDPRAGVQGYWPTYCAIAVFANNKYYVGCGQGPNIALGAPAGYTWPSNSYGQGASYNRQSMMAIYDPTVDTWVCSKWDQTGPVPFNYNFGSGGIVWSVIGDGTQSGSAQAFAFDYDSDGTQEIYMHGGYPQWDGWNFIFDPDLNGGNGSWSTTAAAANFSAGYKCQRRGGCVPVGSNVYVIGGNFWGPLGQCNLQVFEPAANAWTVYENVYGTSLWQFGIGSIGTKVYILGGRERVGNPTETDVLRYSPNVYMLDTTNIAAGLTKVGTLVVGVEQPSVVQWRGLLYVIAGLTAGDELTLTSSATNLFQIFNPATGGTTVSDTPLPVNAYGASCAVSAGGMLYVGGALRYRDADGTNYNASRLWTLQLPGGTAFPVIDITSAPAHVAYDVSSYAVAGTNTSDVVGDMWVSNALAGGTAISFSRSGLAFTAPAVGLQIGANAIRVYGTNMYGAVASDSVAITRVGIEPFVDITNAPVTVTYDVVSYAVAGTNNLDLVGDMWVSNATAGGAAVSFSRSGLAFTAPAVELQVGLNIIRAYGTNMYGTVASDSVVITRGGIGTGAPFIDVTNQNASFANDVTETGIAGTNNSHVVGGMSWSNSRGGNGTFAAAAAWTITNIPLGVGGNIITVSGTNQVGVATNDSVMITRGAGVGWTEKNSNPARFPYEVGAANARQMDLPIPVATNRTFVAYQNSGGGQVPGPAYQTNMIIWSAVDPRYGEEGYWPTYHSASVFANGKYYISAGVGPNVNLASIYGMSGADGKSISMGYMWPSNSWPNGDGYTYNRQAGFAVYDPVADTWQSASWQPADLNGYCIENVSDPAYGTYVDRKPMRGQGTWIGANQAFAFDWDSDGVEEIFMHGGYPHWDGYSAVFDPNRGTVGEWSTTAAANNFSSGNKAQMYGGTVRVGSNIYCLGGNYWGQDGATHMQVYNPALNTWQTYENIYTNQLRHFGCAAISNKIYLFSGEQSPNIAYSPNVYMLDVTSPETIGNGVKIVGQVSVPVRWPSMVSWEGKLYIAGGLTASGPTNVFQIFDPATGATVLSPEVLPFNAYAASCSVSPLGTLYLGGAMRMVDPASGWLVNSSRLWTLQLSGGTAFPVVDITSAPAHVAYDVSSYAVAGTNTSDIVGNMWVSNATVGGTAISFSRSGLTFTTPPAALNVGTNMIWVYGTNVDGMLASDNVAITRGGSGTGAPFVDITNTTMQVMITSPFAVAGTNNSWVIGLMWVSNAANGQQLHFPASQSWVSATLNLQMLTNIIYVFGSNSIGNVTNDTVVMIGVPEGVGLLGLAALVLASMAARKRHKYLIADSRRI